jgi:RNA polymerase sigma-70 factor, ECF subfamily
VKPLRKRTVGEHTGTPHEAETSPQSGLDENRQWRALYHEHFDGIYRFVCYLGVPLSEAEDLTQGVFMRVRARIGDVAGVQSMKGWLRGIALRVVAEHRRWQRVRRVKQWLVQVALEPSASEPAPEESAVASEEQRAVHEVLSHMSPKLREVLVLCDLEESVPEDVAAVLAIPVGTVRSRRRLAKEQFQRLWARTQEHDAAGA